MIESIEFTNFKVLRKTTLPLAPLRRCWGRTGRGRRWSSRLSKVFPVYSDSEAPD